MTSVVGTHAFARAMMTFVLVKSVLLGIAAALIDVSFIKAAILVVLSAVVTGVFGVVVALIQSRADALQHRRLDYLESRVNDVAGVVGANKRDTDPDAGSAPTSPAPRA